MENNGPVVADVQLTSADLRDLWRGSPIRRVTFLLIAIGLLYCYLIFAEIMNDGFASENASTVALYGMVVLLALFGAFFLPILRTKLLFRYDPTLRVLRRYSLSEQGARFESEFMTCDCQWDAFFSIVETRRSFLLYLSPLFGMVISKECLTKQGDADRIRQLFRSHFKSKLKLRG